MKSLFEELGGTYRQEGDYLLPNLTVPNENHAVGIWALRHKRYLKEHRKATYDAILLSGKLNSYPADINEQAEAMFDRIVCRMAASEGVTELLKADDQMEWVRRKNAIQLNAAEIVRQEIIF